MKRIKDMTAEEKKIFSQRVQLYAGVFIIAITLSLFLRWFNTNQISGEGIMPTPRRTVDPIAVTYYAQDDPAWADDALAETGYTMQQEGSIFACLSMVLEVNEGITVTPGQLNAQFIESGLYVNGTAANIAKLHTLYPGADFSAPGDFDGEDITKELRKGRLCMVRVKRGENVHWLTVVGSDQDTFLVLDPAKGNEVQRLEDYEKVFALGLIH